MHYRWSAKETVEEKRRILGINFEVFMKVWNLQQLVDVPSRPAALGRMRSVFTAKVKTSSIVNHIFVQVNVSYFET